MFEGGSRREGSATGSLRDPDAPVTVTEVLDVAEHLGLLLEALCPGEVLFTDAVKMWEGFSLLSRLGSAGATLLARRVDESGAWRRAGYRSVDEYLASLGGESVGDARKQRQAAERLTALPETEEELRKGRLSPGQRDAVTDGAAANPAAERKLLDDARRKSLKDLKDESARAKAAADRDPQATQDRIHRERRLSTFNRGDGSQGVYGQGPVDDVALLEAALKPGVDDRFRAGRQTGDRDARQAYRWDALIELARNFLRGNGPDTDTDTDASNLDPGDPAGEDDPAGDEDHGDIPDTAIGRDTTAEGGTSAEPNRSKPTSTSTRSGTPPYLGLIRVDLEALTRGWVEGDELCEITGLGPIPLTRARELLGESALRLVITKGIDVQNVTYLGRGPNAAQNLALLWSQPFCTNIACPNTFCQRDHRKPYAQVRKTELANLDPLCTHDHDLKTRYGWALVAGTGRRAFVPPEHPQHPNNCTPSSQGTSPSQALDQGVETPRGTGPPPDVPPRGGVPSDELFPDTG